MNKKINIIITSGVVGTLFIIVCGYFIITRFLGYTPNKKDLFVQSAHDKVEESIDFKVEIANKKVVSHKQKKDKHGDLIYKIKVVDSSETVPLILEEVSVEGIKEVYLKTAFGNETLIWSRDKTLL